MIDAQADSLRQPRRTRDGFPRLPLVRVAHGPQPPEPSPLSPPTGLAGTLSPFRAAFGTPVPGPYDSHDCVHAHAGAVQLAVPPERTTTGGGERSRASHRVNRGSSWNNNGTNCQAANRNANTPSNRNNNLGLRLARAPPELRSQPTEPTALPVPVRASGPDEIHRCRPVLVARANGPGGVVFLMRSSRGGVGEAITSAIGQSQLKRSVSGTQPRSINANRNRLLPCVL